MKLEEIEAHLDSGAFMDPGKFLDIAPTIIKELVAERKRLLARERQLELAVLSAAEVLMRLKDKRAGSIGPELMETVEHELSDTYRAVQDGCDYRSANGIKESETWT